MKILTCICPGVTDLDHEHHESVILKLANNSVIANAVAPKMFVSASRQCFVQAPASPAPATRSCRNWTIRLASGRPRCLRFFLAFFGKLNRPSRAHGSPRSGCRCASRRISLCPGLLGAPDILNLFDVLFDGLPYEGGGRLAQLIRRALQPLEYIFRKLNGSLNGHGVDFLAGAARISMFNSIRSGECGQIGKSARVLRGS